MNKKSKKLTLSTETLKKLSEPQTQEVVGGVTRFCSDQCTATYACSGCQPCA